MSRRGFGKSHLMVLLWWELFSSEAAGDTILLWICLCHLPGCDHPTQESLGQHGYHVLKQARWRYQLCCQSQSKYSSQASLGMFSMATKPILCGPSMVAKARLRLCSHRGVVRIFWLIRSRKFLLSCSKDVIP